MSRSYYIRRCNIWWLCIDDFTSGKLNCDLIIHYGHSMFNTFDLDTIKKNFDKNDIILLLGTIQFSCIVHNVHNILKKENYFHTFLPIPQVLPLTKGEVLGCTSPNLYEFLYEHIIKYERDKKYSELEKEKGEEGKNKETQEKRDNINNIILVNKMKESLNEHDIRKECQIFLKKKNVKIIFIADGRFHLESVMIHNPDFLFYRYNPFDKIITEEKYDYKLFYDIRKNEIKKCVNCKSIGIKLSPLGRQGSFNIITNIPRV
ncbi:diphthamide biosynthesis protein [Plasmodium falciparum IGH-CR14]|uniref:2-(3-amino-3-carboxypropyl)histidine synthase subunit 1 n=1 Tax=Plasmodium falciparum IGH-CR14 TaxID=580059 RepID=A0A0L1IDC7_PLAFA|nr:diphthamide biosynthesis protein [Plasmodium falciparum IGH-CR14]